MIPIEEALLYVRPIYLRASGGRIPELKQVVVAYQNQIVMEATLDLALTRLFGGSTPGASPATPRTILADTEPTVGQSGVPLAENVASTSQPLTQEAQDSYMLALEAQRNGDWARYGEEIERLGEVLQRLQQEQ